MRRLAPLLCWLALLLLLALEYLLSFLRVAPALRPLLLLPALPMITLVALVFMRLGRSPLIARGFAVAGVFWLAVLLGLGSMDALTRTLHPAPHGGFAADVGRGG